MKSKKKTNQPPYPPPRKNQQQKQQKNPKNKSEYLAKILERMCAKPQLGSCSQLLQGSPLGSSRLTAATRRMALFNLDVAWKR